MPFEVGTHVGAQDDDPKPTSTRISEREPCEFGRDAPTAEGSWDLGVDERQPAALVDVLEDAGEGAIEVGLIALGVWSVRHDDHRRSRKRPRIELRSIREP